MQTVLATKAELKFSLGISFPATETAATAKYFKLYMQHFLKDATLFQLWTEMDGMSVSHEWILIVAVASAS